MDQHREEMEKGKTKDRGRDEPSSMSKKHLGERDIRLDQDKLADAIRAEKERKRKGGYDGDDLPSGKRKKQESMSSSNPEVTEEELGVYLLVLGCVAVANQTFQRRTNGVAELDSMIPCLIMSIRRTYNVPSSMYYILGIFLLFYIMCIHIW